MSLCLATLVKRCIVEGSQNRILYEKGISKSPIGQVRYCGVQRCSIFRLRDVVERNIDFKMNAYICQDLVRLVRTFKTYHDDFIAQEGPSGQGQQMALVMKAKDSYHASRSVAIGC
jgi:hypothetical protein